ncbi:MAG: succinate dehydrogenase cytochrome b subunit [Candidatus Latescibacterota bacterium]|nr:succinate dehydrogenase cytochrome b subunit [Candidatus Latescibacterota bacterium]
MSRPAVLTSSIGKKVGMAATGLLLYGFLVGHLAGNLLLLKPDDGVAFNEYANFLASRPQLVIFAEIGLIAIFALHVYLAVSLSHDARRARPHGYDRNVSTGNRSLASRTMIWSGLVIFGFLIVHIRAFKFGDRGDGTLYNLVLTTFSDAMWAGGYVAVMALLGFHLWHALGSAFQTLGVSGRRRLHQLSILLCFLIAGGFAVIPAGIFFLR